MPSNTVSIFAMPYTVSVISCKHDIILRCEQERCQVWGGKQICNPIVASFGGCNIKMFSQGRINNARPRDRQDV